MTYEWHSTVRAVGAALGARQKIGAFQNGNYARSCSGERT